MINSDDTRIIINILADISERIDGLQSQLDTIQNAVCPETLLVDDISLDDIEVTPDYDHVEWDAGAMSRLLEDIFKSSTEMNSAPPIEKIKENIIKFPDKTVD